LTFVGFPVDSERDSLWAPSADLGADAHPGEGVNYQRDSEDENQEQPMHRDPEEFDEDDGIAVPEGFDLDE